MHMQAECGENRVTLCGKVLSPAVRSHETGDKTFYRLSVAIRRHSGTEDVLGVLAERDHLLPECFLTGARICIDGQLRSHNERTEGTNRLLLNVLAVAMRAEDRPDDNSVVLEGVLCKPPVFRRTPLGREICDILLAVGRRYGRCDYLPCIAWGACARQVSKMAVGDRLKLTGRMQSRTYIKDLGSCCEERVAYEVSAAGIEPL